MRMIYFLSGNNTITPKGERMMFLSKDFDTSVAQLKELLQKDKNFDLVYRVITICGKKSTLFFIDAFTKDEIIEKITGIRQAEINEIRKQMQMKLN